MCQCSSNILMILEPDMRENREKHWFKLKKKV